MGSDRRWKRSVRYPLQPHVAPRSLGGCDHRDCVVALCWTHHRAYDTGGLELLPHLEPQWRAEVAHAVSHLGLIGAVRRLAPGRC